MIVLWTVPAVEDLESIRDYIAKDSEFYAARFVEKILDTSVIVFRRFAGLVKIKNKNPLKLESCYGGNAKKCS